MYNALPRNSSIRCYLYGASALATAANSGSHLSPFASSFSLLYNSSSRVSVAYSAFGPKDQKISSHPLNKRPNRRGTEGKRTLNDSIHRTAFLAKPTIDTLGHIEIISRRSPRAIFSLLGFNRDGLGRTDRFTQLACDASFFAGRVAAEGVFTTEAWGDGPLLERIVDGISRAWYLVCVEWLWRW